MEDEVKKKKVIDLLRHLTRSLANWGHIFSENRENCDLQEKLEDETYYELEEGGKRLIWVLRKQDSVYTYRDGKLPTFCWKTIQEPEEIILNIIQAFYRSKVLNKEGKKTSAIVRSESGNYWKIHDRLDRIEGMQIPGEMAEVARVEI